MSIWNPGRSEVSWWEPSVGDHWLCLHRRLCQEGAWPKRDWWWQTPPASKPSSRGGNALPPLSVSLCLFLSLSSSVFGLAVNHQWDSGRGRGITESGFMVIPAVLKGTTWCCLSQPLHPSWVSISLPTLKCPTHHPFATYYHTCKAHKGFVNFESSPVYYDPVYAYSDASPTKFRSQVGLLRIAAAIH